MGNQSCCTCKEGEQKPDQNNIVINGDGTRSLSMESALKIKTVKNDTQEDMETYYEGRTGKLGPKETGDVVPVVTKSASTVEFIEHKFNYKFGKEGPNIETYTGNMVYDKNKKWL